MGKDKLQKKYRHGIEIKKTKLKKSELLRRLELLEAVVFGGGQATPGIDPEKNDNSTS